MYELSIQAEANRPLLLLKGRLKDRERENVEKTPADQTTNNEALISVNIDFCSIADRANPLCETPEEH